MFVCSSLLLFFANRYFADEYRKSSLYWSSLKDLMTDNDGCTQQVRAGDCRKASSSMGTAMMSCTAVLWLY